MKSEFFLRVWFSILKQNVIRDNRDNYTLSRRGFSNNYSEPHGGVPDREIENHDWLKRIFFSHAGEILTKLRQEAAARYQDDYDDTHR